MTRIVFLLYDQCMYSAIAGMIDAFSIANQWHRYWKRSENTDEKLDDSVPFEFEVVSPKAETVITEGNVRILPHRSMEDTLHAGLIVIPPYMVAHHPIPKQMPMILDWIQSRYRSGIPIAAACTGTFVLAMTGLLDGRLATTNWQYANRFRKEFPKVHLKPERVLTEDSGLICSGAATAMYHLALRVIDMFGSKNLAHACAKTLLVDANRKAQTPYRITVFRKDHGDQAIIKAQQWMEEHFHETVSVDHAALHAGLSPRHFKRRFKQATTENPLAYLQLLRLEAAKHLLETTIKSIEEITFQVGYEDSSTFRRLFRKYTSLSPREYRDKFKTE
ncbi:MAG: helix-turn-helix domain-containing protein [Thermodesulfobacteriota bacterium]